MKPKILVTGAAGFIGSHLCEHLLNEDYRVKAFVHYNSFGRWGWLDHLETNTLNSIEIFSGDIRDPFGVKKAMSDCDMVLHLAALIGIPYSYHSPQSYVETNIQGTLNILQAAKELDIQRIIHTSTSEVYGTAQYVPIDENHPLQPQSPYSATKISADQLALSYGHAFNLPVTVIRPFNTYGPRQSARAVIPTIITQLANDNSSIKLGAITPTRDFSYVTDTADAFVKALKASNIEGQVVNLGSQFEISVGDTASLIAELMNKPLTLVTDDERLRPPGSEVERLFANHEKAKKLLNWNPHYAGLEGFKKGLVQTIEWFNLYHEKFYKSGLYSV